MGRGAGLTGLVIQKVVLLHELPVQLQGFGCPGGIEDIRVLVEELLEGVECGLAHLPRHRSGAGPALGRHQSSPGSPHQMQPPEPGPAAGAAATHSKGLPQRKPRASRQEGASS